VISTTLYRFRVDLSDVDRGVYDHLDFRTARHPSEVLEYLLTRALAYSLNSAEGLAFSSQGLGDSDAPTLSILDPGSGQTSLWIEIGNPSPKRLHKASKAAQLVKVYTYKDPQLIVKECAGQNVHKADQIEIYGIDPVFLTSLAEDLQRDIKWSLLRHDGAITVTSGERSASTELKQIFLAPGRRF
jgi:uncharacterized protein YaeQ